MTLVVLWKFETPTPQSWCDHNLFNARCYVSHSNHEVISPIRMNLNKIALVMPISYSSAPREDPDAVFVRWRGSTIGAAGNVPFVIRQDSLDSHLQIRQRRTICPCVDLPILHEEHQCHFFVRQASKAEVVFAGLAKLNVGEGNKVTRIAKETSVGKLTVTMIAERAPRTPSAES